MEFIVIENRDTWLTEIPKHHPDTMKYLDFWRAEKKKCIEGVWGPDFDGYRYMPPKLYFYVNYWTIVEADTGEEITPWLGDIVWEVSYLCMEARGFSGFKDDPERTAYREIDTITRGKAEALRLNYDNFLKPDGTKKKYVPARQLLRERHDKPYGLPLYDNMCKNVFILGSRRGGKSKYIGCEIGHEILFDAAKEYTQHSIDNPKKAQLFIGSAQASKSSETCEGIRIAFNALATSQRVGAWGQPDDRDYKPSPFYKDMSGSLSPNNLESPWRHEYKKKIGGRWLTFGSKSSLKHGTYTTENPQVAAGGAYTIMFDEEVGLHDTVKISHYSNEACTKVNTNKFGSIYYAGTAGNMEKIVEAQEMFTNPDNFNIVAYKNTWENSTKDIGFFLPAQYTLYDYKDENGNTKLEEANAYVKKLHDDARRKGPAAYEGELMNYPTMPAHMWIKGEGGLLPTPELRERLRELEADDIYDKLAIPIKITFDSKEKSGVKYDIIHTLKHPTMDHWPLRKSINDREGNIIMYEPPILNEEGYVPRGLYIIGHDPYSKDDPDGLSMASIYVMKTNKYFNLYGSNEIVAVYTGRPEQGRRVYNEHLEKLAMMYGGTPRMIHFENNSNTVEYFEKRKKLLLLSTKPETVLTNKGKGRRSGRLEYGHDISTQKHKLEAIRYIYDWLLTAEETNNEQGYKLTNLDKLVDKPLIQEMISFNLDDNFDRVMAFAGCILGLEETSNQYIKQTEESNANPVSSFLKDRGQKYLINERKIQPTFPKKAV